MSWTPAHLVSSEAELEALYGLPAGPAVFKEIDHVSDHYRAFIAAAPFVIVATSGPGGLDCTPRGDPAGFVRVVDRHTLMLPDRRGNNRLDTLRNLVRDPRIALLFLIPGVGRTLRVNGRAVVTTDPALCDGFAIDGKAPRSVVVVTAERVYTQCPKALIRARLWDPNAFRSERDLPSSGEILQALQSDFDGAAYEKTYPQRVRETIY
jgi:PPOX class probable FMN-dependent enzyme